MNYFEGKVIIVTGSSSGIGEGTAIHFSSLNACVVVTGRDVERVEAVANKCRLLSKNVILEVIADLQNDNDVQILVEKTINTFGKIDILVNNAGIANFSFLTNKDLMEKFDRMMNINLRSVVLLTSLVVPYLEVTKGCIVNVSSLAGIKARKAWLCYCMSKAGLDMLTKCLAMEFGPKGIRVNGINPSLTLTPIYAKLENLTFTEQQMRLFCEMTYPLRRIGYVHDIVRAIEFLASDKASYITGINMPVDGGAIISKKSRL